MTSAKVERLSSQCALWSRSIDNQRPGATWLDRPLVGRHRVETVHMAFGGKIEQALDERSHHPITLGLATQREDGGVKYRPDMLATCSAASWTVSESASHSSAPMD
jgi:hypothetical protein